MEGNQTSAPRSPEVADIFREAKVGPQLTGQESKVFNAIKNCQTSILGGRKYECCHCGKIHIVYNSCRNRHCPKCQYQARKDWVEARIEELLPVSYYHLVFTIPYELRILFLQNKQLCFKLLFEASQKSVLEVAKTKLGVIAGGLSVLHTWTQKIDFHPHIHMIVPGGGLSLDKTKWISAKQNYFLPVKALSKLFQGKLLGLLEKSFEKLNFKGDLSLYNTRETFKELLIKAAKTAWVVYSKAPFAGPEQVINYLGHYTHRIAISNNRIKAVENSEVVFTTKNRDQENTIETVTVSVEEFTRRFLLHTIPKGFVRIRYWGLQARRNKQVNRERCLALITKPEEQEQLSKQWKSHFKKYFIVDKGLCPYCMIGHLRQIEVIANKLSLRSDTS